MASRGCALVYSSSALGGWNWGNKVHPNSTLKELRIRYRYTEEFLCGPKTRTMEFFIGNSESARSRRLIHISSYGILHVLKKYKILKNRRPQSSDPLQKSDIEKITTEKSQGNDPVEKRQNDKQRADRRGREALLIRPAIPKTQSSRCPVMTSRSALHKRSDLGDPRDATKSPWSRKVENLARSWHISSETRARSLPRCPN